MGDEERHPYAVEDAVEMDVLRKAHKSVDILAAPHPAHVLPVVRYRKIPFAFAAALLYLTGYEQWQCATSSVPAMGFNGIAAAFLGGLNPLGTVLASFFIQHITAGGAYVDKTMYCAQISDLISAIIIYLCGFVLFMKYAMNASIAKREEKAIQRAKAAEADGKGGDQ